MTLLLLTFQLPFIFIFFWLNQHGHCLQLYSTEKFGPDRFKTFFLGHLPGFCCKAVNFTKLQSNILIQFPAYSGIDFFFFFRLSLSYCTKHTFKILHDIEKLVPGKTSPEVSAAFRDSTVG